MNFLSRRKAKRGQNEITAPLFFLCHHETYTTALSPMSPSHPSCGVLHPLLTGAARARVKRAKKKLWVQGLCCAFSIVAEGHLLSVAGNFKPVRTGCLGPAYRGQHGCRPELRSRFSPICAIFTSQLTIFYLCFLEICMSGSLRNPNCGSTFPFPAISQMGHGARL